VLVDHLGVLRDAERQLVEALPKVARAATHPALREAVEHHLEETRRQAQRLDTIFGRMRVTPPRARDEVMTALVADAQRFIDATGDSATKDAALIAAAQRVEHHEIAGYGTARTLADELGLDEASSLLNETLDEESNADSLLTRIATGGLFRSGVNEAAADG
jgi:ferritin-like metal-binding protein YciE